MRQVDYIAADLNSAISVSGETVTEFVVGETVSNQDKEAGTAQITGFGVDIPNNEVLVWTTKGQAHLCFIEKV